MFSILENQHRLLSSIEKAQKLLNYKPQMKSVKIPEIRVF